jgi:hypothetical protein
MWKSESNWVALICRNLIKIADSFASDSIGDKSNTRDPNIKVKTDELEVKFTGRFNHHKLIKP